MIVFTKYIFYDETEKKDYKYRH